MRRPRLPTATLTLALSLAGCAAAGLGARVVSPGEIDAALARYEQDPHPAKLMRIAEAVLQRELTTGHAETQRSALAALAGTGAHGRSLLERVADDDSRPALRAHALGMLARMGDEAARLAVVRLLDAGDPELRAEAVGALDAVRDTDVLRRALGAPWRRVRVAAARALAKARPDEAVRLALSEVARRDTDEEVRAAALTALGRQGADALPAIEARLRDEEPSVRTAAIAALVRADAERAMHVLQDWIEEGASSRGIDAARMLIAELGARAPKAARDHIERALASPSAELRGQAASTLGALDDADAATLAARRIDAEPVTGVRLLLALALQPGERRTAVLTALLKADDVVATQAAIALAQARAPGAIDRVLQLRASKSAVARAVVARALARQLDRAHDAGRLLRDPEASVRVATAAAILASG